MWLPACLPRPQVIGVMISSDSSKQDLTNNALFDGAWLMSTFFDGVRGSEKKVFGLGDHNV